MTDLDPAPPELSIIIVTYNSRRHVRDCLESIQKTSGNIPHEVIVVDNASQDGTQNILRNEFPDTRLISNSENPGFARSVNQGISQSRGSYILMLNPDTTVLPKTLETLLNEMKESPETGLLGCRLLSTDHGLQQSFGYDVTLGSEMVRKFLFNLWEKHRFAPMGWILKTMHSYKREVDWVKGACMLARRQVLFNVKLMDENFFMYLEDADLCLRIRQSGWKVCYTPEAEVIHVGEGSVRSNREQCALEFRRSQLHYFKKHLDQSSLTTLKLYLSLKLRKNILAVMLRQWIGWGVSGALEERKQFLRETLSLVQNFQ